MNSQILVRRLLYIAAMVLLLFPIYMLGHPSVRNSAGTELTPGGALASIRSQYDWAKRTWEPSIQLVNRCVWLLWVCAAWL